MLLNILYPLPNAYPNGPATMVVSREGKALRSFADKAGIHRYLVSLDATSFNKTSSDIKSEVDPFYLQALLNYEDRWFYYHPGFNPLSIVRAAWQWLRYGHVISGGSTLTMQVARLIEPHQRSLSGKFKQVLRALQLEWYYSKDEILTLYLNLAPFGGNIQGVEAASQRYFGKSANALSKSEAALLVVLPQKPSLYRPDRYPQTAQAMRNKVLQRLVDYGQLDKVSADFLMQEPVNLARSSSVLLAPLLSRKLKTQHPKQHLIVTSINAELQQRIHRLFNTVTAHLPAKSSAAIVVVNNQNAKVIAYQGSADFEDTSRFSHVDMVTAIRSPGSTLKPFIYGLALDLGIIHSQSLLSDIPYSFSGYKPQNLSGKFIGAVSMSTALKKSLNVPLIQVFNKETPEVFDAKLSEVGIHLQHKKANLSVGLGGTGTNLLTLAAMYRTLATQGQYQALGFMPTKDAETTSSKTLLSPEASWIIFKTLSEISAPDRVVPSVRRQIAWKTGTSYGYRDFWSVGVSPDYTVGVWVGRPDSSPIVGYLGATQAAPIMFDAFDQLPRDKHTITKPVTVVDKTICWPSGRAKEVAAASQCVTQKQAYTIRGITPPTMDSDGQFLVVKSNDSKGIPIWPQSLANWQQQRSIITKQNKSNTGMPHIQHIKTGQHYYKEQLASLPLEANIKNLAWYVNYLPYYLSSLKLQEYSGKVNISACVKLQCDKREIYVH